MSGPSRSRPPQPPSDWGVLLSRTAATYGGRPGAAHHGVVRLFLSGVLLRIPLKGGGHQIQPFASVRVNRSAQGERVHASTRVHLPRVDGNKAAFKLLRLEVATNFDTVMDDDPAPPSYTVCCVVLTVPSGRSTRGALTIDDDNGVCECVSLCVCEDVHVVVSDGCEG